jgi:hypothetical protein
VIHPDLGIPVQDWNGLGALLSIAGYDEQAALLEALLEGYNTEILEGYTAGELPDYRRRVLTKAQLHDKFARGGVIRLLEGATVKSPDGLYRLHSNLRAHVAELIGPSGTRRMLGLPELEFVFDEDAETLLVRSPYRLEAIDLATGTTFCAYQEDVSKKREAQLEHARARSSARKQEKKTCSSHWSGQGRTLSRSLLIGYRLAHGATLEDIALERCELRKCRGGEAPTKRGLQAWSAKRTLIRNVRVTRCKMVNCSSDGVVFENVVIEDSRCASLIGGLFDRVTLRGDIHAFGDSLLTYDADENVVDDDALRAFDAERRAEFYRGVDWALDLRAVDGGYVRIDHIPLELIRLNPELHFVMGRNEALTDEFSRVRGIEYTGLVNDVWNFRRSGRQELLLVANPKSKDFKYEIAALRSLRKAGFVR